MMRRVVDALLRALLLAYPRSFRARFEDDLAVALEDRLAEIRTRRPHMAALLLARLAWDLLFAGARERFAPAFRSAPATGQPSTSSSKSSPVSALIQDVRFALRSLHRRPGFTALVLGTLALGTGASVAVFTVVDGVLLRPLPFPDPDELLVVWSFDTDVGPLDPDGGFLRGSMSQPDIGSVRELTQVAGAEGIQVSGRTLTGVDRPERITTSRSTGGLMDLLEVAPFMGRDLRHEDNDTNAPRVVVVSHAFWTSRLGADPDVIGSSLELAERSWEVVGVAPPDFDYPSGTMIWEPLRLDPSQGCGRDCHVYEVALVRLADGVTETVARQAIGALATSLAAEFPDSNTNKGLHLEPLIDYEVGNVRAGLWVVFGAVGLVLLIVCANTANLQLVRGSMRSREVAVRTALGASRGRLFTQVITESVVLAALGSLLGLALSFGLVEGLRSLAADQLPRMAEVRFHGGVLSYLMLVTAAVAVLFGVSPALYTAGRRGTDQLLGSARTGARGGNRARSALLAAEVALSILLLAGSGLLIRSLGQLYRVDMGFDGADVTRFTLNLPDTRYDDLESLVRFYGALEADLAAAPGVARVGSVYGAPLTGGSISGTVLVEGRSEPEPAAETDASMRPVTPGYFEAMGMTVLRGRGILVSDRTDTEPVAVVNEQFVRENFPNEDVIGHKVRVTASFGYGSPYRRVVGVVRDVRRTMGGRPMAAVYPPHNQYGPGFMQVHVRTRPGISLPATAVRDIVSSLDPNLVVLGLETIPEAKRRGTADTRFFLLLVATFAGVSIVLAGVGLYGVVAFLVAQRTREIGIRMALGARRANVSRMVLRQGLRPTGAGVIVGLALAVYGGGLMEALLYDVRPNDPLVLSGVVVLVLLVATSATVIPARRATRVDPTEALRAE